MTPASSGVMPAAFTFIGTMLMVNTQAIVSTTIIDCRTMRERYIFILGIQIISHPGQHKPLKCIFKVFPASACLVRQFGEIRNEFFRTDLLRVGA